MKENKHIDIDLDFFDEDEKTKSTQQNSSHKGSGQNVTKNDDHLETNLDFLDESNSSVSTNNPSENRGTKYNWIKIFWICVAILVFIGWISSDSGSSSSSTYTPSTAPTTATQNSNSLYFDGETFSCSDYHYDKAIALRPDEVESARVDSEGAALDVRIDALDLESARIENMYVDEYSQYSIDNYNAAVDAYNIKKTRLQSDIDSWNFKNSSFNRKIDTYNNYLDTNCRPQ